MNARERFYSNKTFVEGYTDLIESDRMQNALDAAMIEFHSSLKSPTGTEDAAANEWRRQGALLFRSSLERLGNSLKEPKHNPTGNLNHRA